ncbi:MAG TPA: MmcQ/YjbR family DNA-binding protein [Rhizomicrobium sp.]
MATISDVRKIALALDGVAAVDHFGRPSYRTKKRIFAVMRPDGLFLHFPDERKEFLFAADPKVFVKYMWGARPNVIVQIDKIDRRELEALIREAWAFSSAPAKKPSARRAAKPRR